LTSKIAFNIWISTCVEVNYYNVIRRIILNHNNSRIWKKDVKRVFALTAVKMTFSPRWCSLSALEKKMTTRHIMCISHVVYINIKTRIIPTRKESTAGGTRTFTSGPSPALRWFFIFNLDFKNTKRRSHTHTHTHVLLLYVYIKQRRRISLWDAQPNHSREIPRMFVWFN